MIGTVLYQAGCLQLASTLSDSLSGLSGQIGHISEKLDAIDKSQTGH